MTVYYNRLNLRANNYASANTHSNTVVPSAARPEPNPALRADLTLNLTAGTTAACANQNGNQAGG